MDDTPSGYAVFASMLGVEASVLRAISAPWAGNPCPPPITLAEFALRLDDAQRIAGQLNNTNAWEQAITGAFPPEDIPPSLPTTGVPRPANDDEDKQ